MIGTIARGGSKLAEENVVNSEVALRQTSYGPSDLARWLDRWALRREKILELIDMKAARRARKFAGECRYLAYCASHPDEHWEMDWYTLRLEVASFLAEQHQATHVAPAQRAAG